MARNLPKNLQKGLVMWLDSAGKDISGNGNNGTLVNSPTKVRRLQNDGLSYNGSSQYMTVAAADSLEFGTADFTVSYWLNPTSLSLYGNPVCKYTSSNNGGWTTQTGSTSLDRGNVYMREAGTLNETSYETGTGYFEIGKWILYTIVISSDVKFYKNGVLFQAVSGTRRNVSNASAKITLMKNYTTNYVAGGEINPMIWNRALSTKEIELLRISTFIK